MITAPISSSKFIHTPPLHSSSSISSSSSNLLLVLSPSILSFQLYPYNNRFRLRRYAAVRTTSSGGRGWGSDSYGAELLRKPVVSPAIASEEGGEESDDKYKSGGGEVVDAWLDWEDQILQETVPLVNFVRMILHSGRLVFSIFVLFRFCNLTFS